MYTKRRLEDNNLTRFNQLITTRYITDVLLCPPKQLTTTKSTSLKNGCFHLSGIALRLSISTHFMACLFKLQIFNRYLEVIYVINQCLKTKL